MWSLQLYVLQYMHKKHKIKSSYIYGSSSLSWAWNNFFLFKLKFIYHSNRTMKLEHKLTLSLMILCKAVILKWFSIWKPSHKKAFLLFIRNSQQCSVKLITFVLHKNTISCNITTSKYAKSIVSWLFPQCRFSGNKP